MNPSPYPLYLSRASIRDYFSFFGLEDNLYVSHVAGSGSGGNKRCCVGWWVEKSAWVRKSEHFWPWNGAGMMNNCWAFMEMPERSGLRSHVNCGIRDLLGVGGLDDELRKMFQIRKNKSWESKRRKKGYYSKMKENKLNKS